MSLPCPASACPGVGTSHPVLADRPQKACRSPVYRLPKPERTPKLRHAYSLRSRILSNPVILRVAAVRLCHAGDLCPSSTAFVSRRTANPSPRTGHHRHLRCVRILSAAARRGARQLPSLAEELAENVCDKSVRVRRERSPGRTGSRAERVGRTGHGPESGRRGFLPQDVPGRVCERNSVGVFQHGEPPFVCVCLRPRRSQPDTDRGHKAAQLESRTSIPTPQEPDSVSLQRAVSRASVDSYTVPDRASTPDSRTPINGVPLLGVAAPPQSHPHIVPTGVSAAPKRESSPYGSSPLPPPIKPILPIASATSGVSSSAQLVDARARKRVAGREKKLMGDMWLLSGRPQEAIAA